MQGSIIGRFCAMSMRPLLFIAALFAAALAHAAPAPPAAAELPQATTTAVPAPGVAAQSYFLLDIKLSVKLFNKASIFAAVNNLFNTSYQELERTQAPNRNFNSGIRIEF